MSLRLGPSTVNTTLPIVFELFPQNPTAPYTILDLGNESSVTLLVVIEGRSYFQPAQSTLRYQLTGTETQVTITPQATPSVTGTVNGVAYSASDLPPTQTARGSTNLGGQVGLPVDPLVLGTSDAVVLGLQAAGDLVDRFIIRVDGTLEWGDGVDPTDTSMERVNGTLQILARNLRFGGSVSVPSTPVGLLLGNIGVPVVDTPVNGGWLYCSGGALLYKGSGGTVTVVAPA